MWVFWVLFGVVAVAALLAMVRVERRRLSAHVAACRRAAQTLGASYSYDPPGEVLSKIKDFDLTFADGAMLPVTVRDVFTLDGGGRRIYIFLHEHRGSLPGRAAGGAHRETVACVVSPGLRLPRFRLSPERPVEKLASLLGLRDVDFASHPGFSRSYYLNTEDEATARTMFGPEVLGFFEKQPGWQVEGRGDTLLVYRFRKTMGLEELPALLETVDGIARLFRNSREAAS